METKGRKERKRKKRKKKRNGTKKKSGSAHVRRTTEDLRLLAGRRQPFRESAERGPTDIHHRVLYSSLLRLLLKGEGEGLKEMLKEEEMREPRWWMLVRATITHKVWRRRRLTSWRDDQRTEKRRGTSYAPQNPFLICCSFDCQEAITIESSVACPALSYPVLFFIQSDDDDCLCDDDNKRLTCDEDLASPLLCVLYQLPNCQSSSLPPQKHTQIHREESRVGID